MYRLEIFSQQLEPVDFAPIPETTPIIEDYVSLENFEIVCAKLVTVEYGYVLRIMDENRELAIAIAMAAEQTKGSTRITAAPAMALLDFESLQPECTAQYAMRVWGDANGVYQIHIPDTGSWLTSACCALFYYRTLSNYNDQTPAYCFNGFDSADQAHPTINTSTTAIDGVPSEIDGLFNEDKETFLANVFDVFTASRNIEGRTFRCYFDFTGDRPRLCIDMRRGTGDYVINTDLPNIMEKTVNITAGTGAATFCAVMLYRESDGRSWYRGYYRHPDGTIDDVAVPQTYPEIPLELFVKYNPKVSTQKNLANGAALAKNKMQVGESDNNISITVSIDDKVLPLDVMRSLSKATIIHNGQQFVASYTGCKIVGKTVTYLFGNVRTDLTSKLAIEMRNKASKE